MDKQKLITGITKAIGYVENGGKPDIHHPTKGKSGETASIFQFTPATWSNYSKQVFGKDVPMTADAETHVVMQKISKWIDQGYQPQQIFSMWNAGTGEPDAYSGKFSDGSPSHGVNAKYGVKFDVPSYVHRGMTYLDDFNNNAEVKAPETQNETAKSTPEVATQTQPTATPTKPDTGLQQILSMMSQAKAQPTQSPQGGLMGKTA